MWEGWHPNSYQRGSFFVKQGSTWEVNPAMPFPIPGPGTTGLGLCPKGFTAPSVPTPGWAREALQP